MCGIVDEEAPAETAEEGAAGGEASQPTKAPCISTMSNDMSGPGLIASCEARTRSGLLWDSQEQKKEVHQSAKRFCHDSS